MGEVFKRLLNTETKVTLALAAIATICVLALSFLIDAIPLEYNLLILSVSWLLAASIYFFGVWEITRDLDTVAEYVFQTNPKWVVTLLICITMSYAVVCVSFKHRVRHDRIQPEVSAPQSPQSKTTSKKDSEPRNSSPGTEVVTQPMERNQVEKEQGESKRILAAEEDDESDCSLCIVIPRSKPELHQQEWRLFVEQESPRNQPELQSNAKQNERKIRVKNTPASAPPSRGFGVFPGDPEHPDNFRPGQR